MNYQKIIFFLENIPNQLSKFRSKSWVEIIDDNVQQITPIAIVIKLEAIISKLSSSLI